MTARLARRLAAAAALALAALLGVIAYNSTQWVGTTFPGFFVMANRVVASIALSDGAGDEPARLFQSQVLAVDGAPVGTSAAIYARVAAAPPGTPHAYVLRLSDGAATTAVVPSRVFSWLDWASLFGAFLLNGVAFLAAGLLVFALKPESPASRGLLGFGLATGVFVVTATDLYGPSWFFRLHAVAEALLPAGLIHLALVFPVDHLGHRRRRLALAGVYLPFALLAALYEAELYSAPAYTAIHLVATTAVGLAGLLFIAIVAHDCLASGSALVRRRTGVVALGTVAGLLLPGILMGASLLVGGHIPLNAGAMTAFLFPLSLGYAVVKQDLFEIDVMLRRAISYAVAVVAIAVVYFAVILLAGTTGPARELLAHSPAMSAVLNLGLLLLLSPIRRRVQDSLDRSFFRKGYDAEQALSELSHSLAAARAVDEVVAHVRRVVGETLCPASLEILLRGADGRLRKLLCEGGEAIAIDAELERRAEQGDILARYEWDDGSGRPLPSLLTAFGAELVVPVRCGEDLVGVFALGPKGSGRAYAAHDVKFLRAAASQMALAMINAEAYSQLEELNAGLERQVGERTAALGAANAGLNRSLEELRDAYHQLEQSQAVLIRTDRLATLGRLTAGIAHEVSTPLGAVLNSLKVLVDLGREYAESIDDASVTRADHREIAGEIVSTARTAADWARKAAAFVSRVRVHGREPRSGVAERFALRDVFAETQALLEHRLRAASCRLDFRDHPPGVHLVGDAARLGQVLINLITNAIDAYEDAGTESGRIEVRAERVGGSVVIAVRDGAGGIRPEILPRIFDELYTTKEPGRGTGLGLWIARNLVEESFAGALTVETSLGVGSSFRVTLPAAGRGAAERPTARSGAAGGSAAPAISLP